MPETTHSSAQHQPFNSFSYMPNPSRSSRPRDPYANSNFFEAPAVIPSRKSEVNSTSQSNVSVTSSHTSSSHLDSPLPRPRKYSRAASPHQPESSDSSSGPPVTFEPDHARSGSEMEYDNQVIYHVPYERKRPSYKPSIAVERSTAALPQIQPEQNAAAGPSSARPPTFSTIRDRLRRPSMSTPSPLQKIERGDWVSVWHSGTSQYLQASTSACGLAAMNCGRMAVAKEQLGLKFDDLLLFMMEKSTMTEILSICPLWSTPAHLNAEDIYKMPYFQSVLHTQSVFDGPPNSNTFWDLLRMLQRNNKDQVSFALIVRPPEIITVLRFPTANGKDVFAIFDSHPRPDHPEGAALLFTKSLTKTSEYLANLFGVDPALLRDPEIGWQSEALGMCEAHIIVAKESAFKDQRASSTPIPPSVLRSPTLSPSDALIMRISVEGLLCQKLLADSEREQRNLESEKRTLEARMAKEQQAHEDMILSQTRKLENIFDENQRLRQAIRAKEMEDETVDVLRVEIHEKDAVIEREREEHSHQVAKLMDKIEKLKVKLDKAKDRARYGGRRSRSRSRSRGVSACEHRSNPSGSDGEWHRVSPQRDYDAPQ